MIHLGYHSREKRRFSEKNIKSSEFKKVQERGKLNCLICCLCILSMSAIYLVLRILDLRILVLRMNTVSYYTL